MEYPDEDLAKWWNAYAILRRDLKLKQLNLVLAQSANVERAVSKINRATDHLDYGRPFWISVINEFAEIWFSDTQPAPKMKMLRVLDRRLVDALNTVRDQSTEVRKRDGKRETYCKIRM